jgi:flagellar hook-associated protein 1 FlgK
VSGLFASLNSSVNALNAHSRAVETAGKNLGNVSNPNYARQRVIYGDRGTVVTPHGAQSLGLEALGVQQLRDKLLDRQVVREAALSSYYQAQQNAYQRAQAALGQDVASASSTQGATSTTTDNGIAAALDDFFGAFHSFAANPTDTGQRQTLLQSASILTDRVRLADTRLAQVQADLDYQVESDVGDTNRLLQTIAELNGQIGRFEINHPGSAVDLRDQRQAALEKLAAKMPIETLETDGQLEVTARDGNGDPVVLVSLAVVQGSIAYDSSTTPPTITGGAANTVLELSSGSIHGSMSARTGAIQTIRDQLDQLTRQLVTSVNEAYNPGGALTDFFDAGGTSAGGLSLDASLTAANLRASNGGAAGDNTVAIAIAQLATKKFSTTGVPPDEIDGSFGGFFAGAVSGLGQAVAGATTRVNEQSRIEQLVRSQRDAVSGVSLDEEMADLMKYQRAFQASSRVFTTIDNLLDVVVNQLGR